MLFIFYVKKLAAQTTNEFFNSFFDIGEEIPASLFFVGNKRIDDNTKKDIRIISENAPK